MTTCIPQINVRNLTLFSDKKEEWQRRHILDNLPYLILLTSCNVLFLSIIRQEGALSEYDEQELLHKFPVEKSKHFYEILIRRKNCYHTLRNALEQTRQSGALEFLDNALLTDVLKDLDVPLSRMSEFKNNINAKFGENGDTLIHKAVEIAGVQQLEKLKLLKVNFEAKNADGYTPLLWISYKTKSFRELLLWFQEQQVNLNCVCNKGNNLAFLASLYGRSKSELQLIVDIGVKWKSKNKFGQNIMHLAAESGNTDALKYFKSLGTDVNARDNFGATPLLLVARAGQNFAKTLKWFVQEQIDLHTVDYTGNNLVFLAALNGRSKSELKLLLDTGVKWDIKHKNGQTVMHLAAEGGNTEALSYFKTLGADINARNTFGSTPILHAAKTKQNFAETFAWFESERADWHVVDKDGNNLVFWAAFNKRSKSEIEEVVDKGVDWNIKNNGGRTVMHWAAEGGNIEALEYFKKLGADVIARDNCGNTPFLQIAQTKSNFREALAWFMEQGVDLFAKTNSGQNLADLFVASGKSNEELQFVIKCGIALSGHNKTLGN